jgi:hypothetical protein
MPAYTFRTAEATVPVAGRAAEIRADIAHILGMKPSDEVAARIEYVVRIHLVDHEHDVRRAYEASE